MKWAPALIIALTCSSCMSFSGLLPVLPDSEGATVGINANVGFYDKKLYLPELSFDIRYRINDELDVGIDLASYMGILAGEAIPFVTYYREVTESDAIAAFAGIPVGWIWFGLESLRFDVGAAYIRELTACNKLLLSVAIDPCIIWNEHIHEQDEIPPVPYDLREEFPLIIGVQDVQAFPLAGQDSQMLWKNQVALYHQRFLGIESGIYLSPIK